MTVMKCTCKHSFQDSRYGRGMRVFNPRRDGTNKCTVCGNTKGTASSKNLKQVDDHA